MDVDLMFCCLGNGVTVCNRAQIEHGDYKNVAHISPCGVYRLYCKLPLDAVNRIREMAISEGKRFEIQWRNYTPSRRLDELADHVMTWEQFKSEGGYALLRKSPEESLELVRKYHCINGRYIDPRLSQR